MVEVDDVLLDFRTEQLTRQRSSRENNDALECLMRLNEAETFPAHETSCAENHYRAGIRHTAMTLSRGIGYRLTDKGLTD